MANIELLKSEINGSVVSQTITHLNWRGPFSYPNLVSVATLGDGNCFFHSIVQGFYRPYVEGYIVGTRRQVFDRFKFVRELKIEIANSLDQPRKLPDTTTWYDSLSRGKLLEMSKDKMPQYELKNMQTELRGHNFLNNIFHEYTSEILGLDIYLLHGDIEDVYMLGDKDLLYKGRKSVIILYQDEHYSTVGALKDGVTLITFFLPDDEIIIALNNRIRDR